jgi:hypothetical protein
VNQPIRLTDVYGITRDVPANYVARDLIWLKHQNISELLAIANLSPDVIAIHSEDKLPSLGGGGV